MKLIKQSRLWEMMERTDTSGDPLPFQMKYVKKNGEVREYQKCVLTSMHSKGTTLNVLPEGESTPRTIRRVTIIEFNHVKVYL